MDRDRVATYAAGIIDADGTITTGGEKRNYKPSIQVYNKDRRILEVLKKEFGGGIHPVQQSGGWNWTLSKGTYIAIMLKTILPYLIRKEKQARLAIKLCSLIQTPYGSYHLGIKLQNGWKLSQEILQARRRLSRLIREENRLYQRSSLRTLTF